MGELDSIDPAEVAAQIVNSCAADECGNCIEHDYNTIWDNGVCEMFDLATERVRAAAKKAWLEGYTAAAKQHPDVAFIGARCPYQRSGSVS